MFLLFLDCVWQLVHQHPPAFEFTETFLTVLSDSLYIPIFSTFFFNSPHQKDTNMVRVPVRDLCVNKASSYKLIPDSDSADDRYSILAVHQTRLQVIPSSSFLPGEVFDLRSTLWLSLVIPEEAETIII